MELNLGEAVQALRKKRSLSQGEVAERLHVSVQAVSKWETGKANPDLFHLPRLAELFGVSIDELFSVGTEPPAEGDILEQNSSGWNRVAQTEWAGTYLPSYGPYTPSEEKLCLLGDVRGKAVLELACASKTGSSVHISTVCQSMDFSSSGLWRNPRMNRPRRTLFRKGSTILLAKRGSSTR